MQRDWVAVVRFALVGLLGCALVGLMGCAVGALSEDAGPDDDAAISGVVSPPTAPPAPLPDLGGGEGGMGGTGGIPIIDMMPPPDMPVGGQPPENCMAGTRIGLCSICGNDGTPRNPGTDDQCPIDCAGVVYEQAEQPDGSVTCTLNERAAMVDTVSCTAVGVCDTDPTRLCGEPLTQDFGTAGPCQVMGGCVGEEPPQIMVADDGTACGEDGAGMCVGGTCELDDPCAIDNPFAGEFCGEGMDGVNGWCEWYVNGPGNNDYSCNDFCGSIGMQCLAVWNNDGIGCRHGGGWDCGERGDDQICRCTYP